MSDHRSDHEPGRPPDRPPDRPPGGRHDRVHHRAVYAISVAAELTGAGVQNLRVYERRGLVEPGRTEGGTRRYSEADLDRVRRVLELLDDGLNLAGIALVLSLEQENATLRGRLAEARGTTGNEPTGLDGIRSRRRRTMGR